MSPAPIAAKAASPSGPSVARSSASTFARLVVVAIASFTPRRRASPISRPTPGRSGAVPASTSAV